MLRKTTNRVAENKVAKRLSTTTSLISHIKLNHQPIQRELHTDKNNNGKDKFNFRNYRTPLAAGLSTLGLGLAYKDELKEYDTLFKHEQEYLDYLLKELAPWDFKAKHFIIKEGRIERPIYCHIKYCEALKRVANRGRHSPEEAVRIVNCLK